MESSENCLLYTGAGISTASGIGDYATQVEKDDRPRLRSPMEAQPTYAHVALKELYHKKIIQYWGEGDYIHCKLVLV
jgi:NAD-dependent SIR2 family protein deacetylase